MKFYRLALLALVCALSLPALGSETISFTRDVTITIVLASDNHLLPDSRALDLSVTFSPLSGAAPSFEFHPHYFDSRRSSEFETATVQFKVPEIALENYELSIKGGESRPARDGWASNRLVDTKVLIDLIRGTFAYSLPAASGTALLTVAATADQAQEETNDDLEKDLDLATLRLSRAREGSKEGELKNEAYYELALIEQLKRALGKY